MDSSRHLLCSPANPSVPIEKTPFISGNQRWDGGEFKLYGKRNEPLNPVSTRLRDADDGTPHTSDKASSPVDAMSLNIERQAFYQTWFFFGLLAEFFEINDVEGGKHNGTMSIAEKSRLLDALYDDFTADAHGIKYVTIEKLLGLKALDHMMTKVCESPLGQLTRVSYLCECLTFTSDMINMIKPIRKDIDLPIWISISALGEFLTTVVASLRVSSFLTLPVPGDLAIMWPMGYVDRDHSIEARMVESGWCISDVERMDMLYHRLNTQHFISHLKKPNLGRDHSSCSRQTCNAAKIDMKSYKLSHALENCFCSEIEIDLGQFAWDTSTYPILRIDFDGDLESMTVELEPYNGDQPYVAISHVWADGLGNPNGNSLQRCQVLRLAALLQDLQRESEASREGFGRKFLLWIDTLCCPAVEKRAKAIAIGKLPTVYTQAKHVLVLDSSIRWFPSQGAHPAELCLRVLASCDWMKRLWTLQEGALAKSLYFQFADQPISIFNQLMELRNIAMQDPRYLAVWLDIRNELAHLHSFFQNYPNTTWFHEIKWPCSNIHERLYLLQGALHFRSVSVESDEPLCIASLLSLDLRKIATLQDHDDRMEELWRMFAREGGGISARIIFFVDNHIPRKGVAWAPRSLLGSNTSIDNYKLSTGRFHTADWGDLGTLSSLGLGVRFPGFRVSVKSWWDGFPPFIWFGLLTTPPKSVLCRSESTGHWFRMGELWPAKKQTGPDQAVSSSLASDVQQGDILLIEDTGPRVRTQTAYPYLMVKLREKDTLPQDTEERDSLYVYACSTVLLCEVDSSYARGLDAYREHLLQVGEQQLIKRLIRSLAEGQLELVALAELVHHVRKSIERAFDTDERVKTFVLEHTAFRSREDAWKVIPAFLPFDIILSEMPRDQSWVVDREV